MKYEIELKIFAEVNRDLGDYLDAGDVMEIITSALWEVYEFDKLDVCEYKIVPLIKNDNP